MPTTSRSSPTTTSAVNEKRRPPLTTLATRLISTTRSWRSRPAAETVRSRAMSVPSRVAAALALEGQPALASSLGKGLHTTVVLVPAAIEHGALDPGRLGALGEEQTGPLGLVDRLQRAKLALGPAHRRQGAAAVIVDQLREDPAVGAEHADPRALGATAHLRADATTALQALRRFRQHRHARLPTFLATYSPS